MKKSIKIIISILITFMLMLATKSYAALECKKNAKMMLTTQEKAFQLCYDMRDPTSSLGNNSLDPHLMLNKDLGVYSYLGMSAYGTNGNLEHSVLDQTVWSTTPSNLTGVLLPNGNINSWATSGTLDGASIVQKYGKSKYLEIFNSGDYTIENTKGMAIIETKGWYNSRYMQGINDRAPVLARPTQYSAYDYGITTTEASNLVVRPVIWN